MKTARTSAASPPVTPPANKSQTKSRAKTQLRYELISGVSGLILALFMWGHMVLVGSILTGAKGFNWMAEMLEVY